MKKLLILIAISISFSTLNAQEKLDKTVTKDRSNIIIKTTPFSTIFGGIKLGMDYSIDENYTHDAHIGLNLNNSYDGINGIHGLYRFKTDMIQDNKKLNGVYFAPGIIVANIFKRSNFESSITYSTIFVDLGIQASRKYSIDFFIGIGHTISQRINSGRYSAGCSQCGTASLASTLNSGPRALRLGMHVGINPT